jgi:hypothetical protein
VVEEKYDAFDEKLLSSKKTEYKVYRFLLEAFAPKLAEVFQHGVRAIKLDNITPPAFEVFISWLKYSFHCHTDGSHPNEIAAKIPNDHLIQSECNGLSPRSHD